MAGARFFLSKNGRAGLQNALYSSMSAVSAYAPGRVEFLGNHTDYNQGVVLAAAIDRGLTVSGHAREDGRILLRSLEMESRVEVPVAALRPQTEATWANYALGVVDQLLAEGCNIPGFEAEVSGNLPPGAGLSSSAAFEVASACFLNKLASLALEPMQMAKLCQRAEARFAGVQSGLLDQVTSIFGRADHLVFLDCRDESIRTIPFPNDVRLIIADSGMKHSLLHGQYNARRKECAAAAKALGVGSLREIEWPEFESRAAGLDPLLRRRAAHVVGENARVWAALQCLEKGDVAALGALMNDSHESSRLNFENSTPALDTLVELARSLPGVYGSRLTGGGFGGATVTLVAADLAAEVAEQLARRYSAALGRRPQVFVCAIADGAK